MLLLRDFLRFAASDAADTSTVAFSFSPALLDGERPLSDLRALLVAGSVTSPCGGMLLLSCWFHMRHEVSARSSEAVLL